MKKIFCVIGKSGSGKDTIFARLAFDETLQVKRVVPYTTRPIRSGEKNGEDYFFVNVEEYEKMKQERKIIESRTYQTVYGPWHYFTADDGQIDLRVSSSILIGTLEVYDKLCHYYGKNQVVPIYIEVEDGLRLERALAREKKQEQPKYAEMCRRFLADCEDFSEEKLVKLGIEKRYVNENIDICCEEIRKTITEAKTVFESRNEPSRVGKE